MNSPVPGDLDLIGRVAELATLSARLDEALGGAGQLICLAGEPGIGKTRLAAALAQRARERGVRVLWGRCSEDPGAPAFWPWLQILRAYVRDLDADVLAAQLGPGAAEIAQVVSEVRDRVPLLPALEPLAPEQARFRFFESLTAFLARAARAQPLLLALDDLHWADASSLLLLEFLGSELRQLPLLVVGTVREAGIERGHPLVHTLAALTRSGACDRLVLDGLSERDVALCLTAVTGVEPTPEATAAVRRATAGNPFFVIEAARRLASEALDGAEPTAGSAWRRHSPLAPRQILAYRLDRLPAACHRVLAIAAVIGHEFGLRELERVADLSEDALLELLDRAELDGVIGAAPGVVGRYRFRHALIREALYEELPAARRIRLHRLIARALEQEYASGSHPYLGQLAYHFLQAASAEDAEKAVIYARAAGEAARASLAYEEAAWYFALALQALQWQPAPEDSQHGALLLALGEAQNWSGQAEAARDTFLAAAAIARRLGDAESLARAAIGYGAVAEAGTTDPVRIALLEEALAAAGGGARRTRVQTLNALAAALYWSEPERSIACSQQALDLATQLGDHLALAHALNARREALWRTEQLTERNAASTALQAAAEKAGDAELRLWAYRWRIVDLLELGDRAMMEREIAAHAGLTERLRPPLHVWYAARWRAMTALLAGRSAEAEDLVQRAHILGLRTRRRDATPLYIVQWGALRRQQGRADELVGRLRELVEQLPDAPVWRAGLAAVYAELGSFAEARRELERLAGAGFADLPRDTNWLVTLTSLAQVCAALPDPERAAQLYELLLPYSARFVVVGAAVVCHGAVAHYLALLATALGRWQAAQQHFVGAHALHQRLGARPWLAMTLAEHAALLASRGDADAQAEARALLAQANELARELGMAGVVRRAQLVRERLEAGRSRFPHASRGQDGALTAREREVARLLARGLTNRQIAQTLVISDRTADAHVANIFGKLGFNTRAQVAAWAVEAGLLSPGADG